jgi:hypothetical protein
MLTGALPFSGLTAAELTLQHMHDEPDLTPLPAADRYIVSRALAKDPSQRFPSCTELIASLLSTDSASTASWSVPEAAAVEPAALAERQPGPVTELFGEELASRRREITKSMLFEIEPPQNPEARALPPLELPAEEFVPSPALVIGIGGVAGGVIKQLRQRIAKQFGDEGVPAVQMLLFDTDPKAIARALQGDARTALKPEETLSLPLRRPQEYRDQSTRLTRWLSRRWLYNIPRSLRTEGMRPLGRLALADHARQAVQRIRMALAAATGDDAADASRERTGMAFGRKAPRVYIVAATSGGCGSGMSIDVGYAVRAALDKMGAANAPIIGVFLHGAGRDPRHCDLAKVNSYAWLTEYNQFHRPGAAFPGDDSCGLPAMPPGRKAFDSAYLVDIGVDAEEGPATQAASAIAEFVYLDALTPAQAFFDACRRDVDPHCGVAPLRTFSLQRTPAASDATIDRAAALLSREVVLSWSGHDFAAGSAAAGAAEAGAQSLRDTNQMVQGAATLVSQLQLKLEGLASNARSLVEAQFGGDQQAFLVNLLATLTPDGKALSALDHIRAVDRLFAPPHEEQNGSFVLERPLDGIVSPLSMKLAGDLAQWVLRRLDDRQERLGGAQRAAQWLVEHLKGLEGDATRLAEGLGRQIASVAEEVRRENRADAAPADDALARTLAYFRMRIDRHAVWASALIAKRLLAELKSIGTTVAEFGRHLKHLAVNLPGVGGTTCDIVAELGRPLAKALSERLPALLDAIDADLQQQFIDGQGGLFTTIMGNSRVRTQMMTALGQLARRAAEQLASQPDVINSAFGSMAAGSCPGADVRDPADGAMPPLLQFGGAYRRLTVLPSECIANGAAEPWRQSLSADATLLAAPGRDVINVCEGSGLPLVHVALSLIQNRRDYADFASRVHTRSDVAWTPLTSPSVAIAPPADAFAALSGDPVHVTQML